MTSPSSLAAPTAGPSAAVPSPWKLSAFWFGSAFLWLLLLLILMPADVKHFVGDADKGKYLGLLGGIGAVVALVLPPTGWVRACRGCAWAWASAWWGWRGWPSPPRP